MGDEKRAEQRVTRRGILGTSLTVVAGCAGLLGPGFVIARYLDPMGAGGVDDHAEIPLDGLGMWQAQRIQVRGRPGFVVRTPNAVYGVSGACTHLGCIVRWQQSQRVFFCPCHGARFAPDGRVLGGPVSAPLPALDVTVNRGKVVVRKA